ncbi:GIY-YIG nuclease family protein [Sphingomonas oryzagri]|uniref:GIY-YIG nuclease family protein n=1 Tax=Sphingomonas oryzagri TaxID=3042314 RepID=A0ABT6MX70_9SPHN|nr:GIY-YIG nuclease family protein [Sphingomonas oryzagri]MDH7637591.1 GIY-YIG nuclease family protein [Sphingomonas oryzagri]
MLRCADGRYYVGHTDALEARVAQHEAGKGSDFTARRRPVMLVWSEAFSTRAEALAAERQVKGWSRAKKEALIAGDWKRVSELAVSREARPSTSLRTNGFFEASVQSGGGEAGHINTVRPELVEGRAPNAAPTP